MDQISRTSLSDLRKWLRKQDLRVLTVLILLLFVVSGAINYKRIAFPTDNDYSLHVLYAQHFVEGNFQRIPPFNLAHPTLQIILAAIHYVSFKKLGLYASLMVVQTITSVLTGLILYFWLGEREGENWNWVRAFWSISLTIISPVILLALQDGQYYFGYIGLANYHNPTIHMLRPIALLSFVQAMRVFSKQRASGLEISASASLIILSALIKPNYAICVLPALGIIALLRYYKKRPVDWRLLSLGFILPAGLILFFQWLVGYALAPGDAVPILLRPFEVENAFSSNLLAKLLLSIAFPLIVTVFSFRQVIEKPDYQLAWLSFIIGAAQMYLLAEGADRLYHGNFRWGAQVTLFLVFAVVVRNMTWWKTIKGIFENRRSVVFNFTYFAHIIAGIVYYIRVFVSPEYG
jgi:hypothetical protein